MTKRQDYYLKKVLGFAGECEGDREYIKTDFVRLPEFDYGRIMAVKFFEDGKIEGKVTYSRVYDDDDPTPIDLFIPDSAKIEDKNIMIFIIQTLKTDFMKVERNKQ